MQAMRAIKRKDLGKTFICAYRCFSDKRVGEIPVDIVQLSKKLSKLDLVTPQTISKSETKAESFRRTSRLDDQIAQLNGSHRGKVSTGRMKRIVRADINMRDEVAEFFAGDRTNNIQEYLLLVTRGAIRTVDIIKVKFASDFKHCEVHWSLPNVGTEFNEYQKNKLEEMVTRKETTLSYFLTKRFHSGRPIEVVTKRV